MLLEVCVKVVDITGARCQVPQPLLNPIIKEDDVFPDHIVGIEKLLEEDIFTFALKNNGDLG